MAIQPSRVGVTLGSDGAGDPAVIAVLAMRILNHSRIELARSHSSKNKDNATARANTVHQMFELAAQRSSYKHGRLQAPGGTVQLDVRLLRALLELSKPYSFAISEIAGGAHSDSSRHYAGIAVDIYKINGEDVSVDHPNLSAFVADCRALGAAEILHPPQKDHKKHIHVAWPRT